VALDGRVMSEDEIVKMKRYYERFPNTPNSYPFNHHGMGAYGHQGFPHGAHPGYMNNTSAYNARFNYGEYGGNAGYFTEAEAGERKRLD